MAGSAARLAVVRVVFQALVKESAKGLDMVRGVYSSLSLSFFPFAFALRGVAETAFFFAQRALRYRCFRSVARGSSPGSFGPDFVSSAVILY